MFTWEIQFLLGKVRLIFSIDIRKLIIVHICDISLYPSDPFDVIVMAYYNYTVLGGYHICL